MRSTGEAGLARELRDKGRGIHSTAVWQVSTCTSGQVIVVSRGFIPLRMGSGVIKPSSAPNKYMSLVDGAGGRPSLKVQARRLPLRLPNRGEMSVGWPSAQAPSRRLTNWSDATKRPHDMAPDSHSAWPSACLTALTRLAVGDFLSRWRLPRSALALRPSQPVRVVEGVTVRLRRPETEPNALLLRCSMTSWRCENSMDVCVRALKHPGAAVLHHILKRRGTGQCTID